MAANEIRVGDIGTVFYGTILDQDSVIVDLSTVTTKQVILLRPDGTFIQKDASFVTDGTNGQLSYTTESQDLNMCGVWRIQWYVVFSASRLWKTDIHNFKVYSNLT